MEIKVDIPKNDYVRPTVVRQKIVQDICSHIVRYLNYSGFYTLRIHDFYDASAELYLLYRDSGKTETIGFHNNGRINAEIYRFYEKVRSCEMKAVFNAIQKAGYHIFASHCITDNWHTYVFSKVPVLNGYNAIKIDFNLFID